MPLDFVPCVIEFVLHHLERAALLLANNNTHTKCLEQKMQDICLLCCGAGSVMLHVDVCFGRWCAAVRKLDAQGPCHACTIEMNQNVYTRNTPANKTQQPFCPNTRGWRVYLRYIRHRQKTLVLRESCSNMRSRPESPVRFSKS